MRGSLYRWEGPYMGAEGPYMDTEVPIWVLGSLGCPHGFWVPI